MSPWDEASLARSDELRKLLKLPVPIWQWRKKKEPGAVPVETKQGDEPQRKGEKQQ